MNEQEQQMNGLAGSASRVVHAHGSAHHIHSIRLDGLVRAPTLSKLDESASLEFAVLLHPSHIGDLTAILEYFTQCGLINVEAEVPEEYSIAISGFLADGESGEVSSVLLFRVVAILTGHICTGGHTNFDGATQNFNSVTRHGGLGRCRTFEIHETSAIKLL